MRCPEPTGPGDDCPPECRGRARAQRRRDLSPIWAERRHRPRHRRLDAAHARLAGRDRRRRGQARRGERGAAAKRSCRSTSPSTNDLSLVSSVRLGLTYDRRDNPALPTRGCCCTAAATSARGLTRQRLRLPAAADDDRACGCRCRGATARRCARARSRAWSSGARRSSTSSTPRTLSDLIPSRVLEINFDRRAPPTCSAPHRGDARRRARGAARPRVLAPALPRRQRLRAVMRTQTWALRARRSTRLRRGDPRLRGPRAHPARPHVRSRRARRHGRRALPARLLDLLGFMTPVSARTAARTEAPRCVRCARRSCRRERADRDGARSPHASRPVARRRWRGR